MDIVERMQRDLDIGCSASIGDTKKAIAEIKRLREKPELTPAQYWEAQASMWHENYKELKQADMLKGKE